MYPGVDLLQGAHADGLEVERMHGARRHVGRVPGIAESELARAQRISDLEQELDAAIREEAYERAASIRDELKALDGPEEAEPRVE